MGMVLKSSLRGLKQQVVQKNNRQQCLDLPISVLSGKEEDLIRINVGKVANLADVSYG